MAAADYDWGGGELTEEEVRLIRAYEKTARPLDALAYTEEFDRLVSEAGFEATREGMHKAFMKLLNLRKRGRLPRHVHAE